MNADGFGRNHLSVRRSAGNVATFGAVCPHAGSLGANFFLTVILFNIYKLTMTQITEPDPAYIRTREAHHHLIDTLLATLPPPPDASPEALHCRNQSAIAQVTGLCPVTAAEAALAAQYVAGTAHAMACMRLASLPDTDRVMALKCYAQAASMMRHSQAALRTLQRTQAIREKRDADPIKAGTAAWAEHMAAAAMTDALTSPKPEMAPPEPEPEPDAPDVALYEAIYPDRAALIRRHGGVPADVTFGPTDEDMVRALLATRSTTLNALDPQAA
jgi:hypothetical protein